MHCELVVPGLLSADAGQRLPALELLLARGRRASPGEDKRPAGLEAWLLEAFDLEEGPLCAGALTLLAHGGDPGDALWARADPVHLQLMRDRVVFVPGAAFPISRDEAQALAAALNGHFAGRLEVQALEPARWCARLAADLDLPAFSPLEMAGRGIDPGSGADALLNEVQMVLHEHPVNEAREARGEPPLNSVWLWGAGGAPHGANAAWQSVSADEPIALGLARAARIRSRAVPESAQAWLERAPEEGRHLVVLDALRLPLALADAAAYARAAEDLEKRWFAPLLGALRAGRIGMVSVHVPDPAAGASFETVRGDLRRFWRRARPLRETMAR
jgi:hypothetical protein